MLVGPGAYSDISLKHFEIVLLPSLQTPKCNVSELPVDKIHAYMTNSDDDGISICGGVIGYVFGVNWTSECFRLSFNTNKWIPFPETPSLSTKRRDAGSVRLGQAWWIAGGESVSYFATTEVRAKNGTWIPGPLLPNAVGQHCMVNIDNKRVFLTGGRYGSHKSMASTYIYNMNNNT